MLCKGDLKGSALYCPAGNFNALPYKRKLMHLEMNQPDVPVESARFLCNRSWRMREAGFDLMPLELAV
jgi:hypothetical protein